MLTRRTMIALAGATPALIATRPARSAAKVLKVVLAVDMRGIDPVFNTAAYAAYHGYLVYDQLFALDSRGKPQPQMVDSLAGLRQPQGLDVPPAQWPEIP